jgi:hypothetical protein
MHSRQEWFRCGRDLFLEQLNSFAALARGIVMLVKTEIIGMQLFSKTRVDYFALAIGVGQAAKFIKRATDERVIIATRAPRLLRCMSLALARMRHSKIADGLPLSGEERSCSGHHPDDRV